MEWACKQTHVWSAPRSLAGWRERMYLLLSFESPPKPKHQSRKSTCSKRENWDKWKALQIFVFKIPWEHIEFGPWKQSSICTFDFSQFSINKKKKKTTQKKFFHHLHVQKAWACFVSQLTYSYQVSYTHFNLLPQPHFWLELESPPMELGTDIDSNFCFF